MKNLISRIIIIIEAIVAGLKAGFEMGFASRDASAKMDNLLGIFGISYKQKMFYVPVFANENFCVAKTGKNNPALCVGGIFMGTNTAMVVINPSALSWMTGDTLVSCIMHELGHAVDVVANGTVIRKKTSFIHEAYADNFAAAFVGSEVYKPALQRIFDHIYKGKLKSFLLNQRFDNMNETSFGDIHISYCGIDGNNLNLSFTNVSGVTVEPDVKLI